MPESSEPSRVMLLSGGRVLTPSGIETTDVLVAGDHVRTIEPAAGLTEPVPVMDVSGFLIAPGFIDLQINGGFGHDFTRDPSSIWEVGMRLPEYGVTAFLPTIITAPAAAISEAQRVLAEGPPEGYSGAIPIGLHLEGPMLSSRQSGTHDKYFLREPASVDTETWSVDSHVRMVTLAPELPGALAVITELTGHGVVVSIGHSSASYDEATAGIRAGATVATHLFNAMSGFRHREPGLAGAILENRDVFAGMIVDGIHSHPATVRIAWHVKGPDHLVLITDAMAAMGVGYGTFAIADVDVVVGDTGPRNASGALAGSVLTMDEAVRNLVAFADCSEEQAVRAASGNAAQVIGERLRGVVHVGARADLVLLDRDLHVRSTLVGGEVVYAIDTEVRRPS